jgi:FixJ family two-component response regulator
VSTQPVSVISPDKGLRHSIVFALEVEGYRVEAHDSWQGWLEKLSKSLCTIVDGDLIADFHRFLAHDPAEVGALIVLSDGMSHPFDERGAHVLPKPFAGSDLIKLVRKLVPAYRRHAGAR